MLDHDHRHIAAFGDAREHAAYRTRAIRVEVRGRLVQEQHARSERKDPRDREALFLAARERGGRAVLAVWEADISERPVDTWPDLSGGDAVVLETESDIVAGSCHHELRLGVLEHQARGAAYGELAFLIRADRIEQTGDRLKERALPGAGRPQQEDALALVDPQIDSTQGPRPAAGVAPTPAARQDGRFAQTRCCARPAGNCASTPVWTSDRMRSHEPIPAITIALTTMNARITSCGPRPMSA